MYVKDLEDGVLIRPIGDWEWAVHRLHEKGGDGIAELEGLGVFYHSSVRYQKSRKIKQQDPAVYVGKRILQNHYYGLKTHHLILVNGLLAAIDGYCFKDVEKI
jgi:hypothetical protein